MAQLVYRGYIPTYGGSYPLVNVYSLLLKMAIEIVDLPIKNGDFPYFFVCLPETIVSLGSKICSKKPSQAEARLARLLTALLQFWSH